VLTFTTASKLQAKSEIGAKRILILLPIAAPSHHNIFASLIDELLARGHFVTIVSARAQKAKQPRLREILIEDPMKDFLRKFPLKYVFLQRGAFDSAKNHKRQRRKRQSVTAKREKSQTPKFV